MEKGDFLFVVVEGTAFDFVVQHELQRADSRRFTDGGGDFLFFLSFYEPAESLVCATFFFFPYISIFIADILTY